MIYVLSPAGRALTWGQWKSMGGCDLSHTSRCQVSSWLDLPQSRWEDITLGQIQGAWVVAGREMARFAVEVLDKPFFAVGEQR